MQALFRSFRAPSPARVATSSPPEIKVSSQKLPLQGKFLVKLWTIGLKNCNNSFQFTMSGNFSSVLYKDGFMQHWLLCCWFKNHSWRMDMDNGKWQIQNSYFAPFLSTQGISRLNVRGTTTSSSKVAPKQEKIKYDEECWKRLDSNKAEHANNSPALHLSSLLGGEPIVDKTISAWKIFSLV